MPCVDEPHVPPVIVRAQTTDLVDQVPQAVRDVDAHVLRNGALEVAQQHAPNDAPRIILKLWSEACQLHGLCRGILRWWSEPFDLQFNGLPAPLFDNRLLQIVVFVVVPLGLPDKVPDSIGPQTLNRGDVDAATHGDPPFFTCGTIVPQTANWIKTGSIAPVPTLKTPAIPPHINSVSQHLQPKATSGI